jgi:hypothetical protein
MHKLTLLFLLFCAVSFTAQTKSTTGKNKKPLVTKDSIAPTVAADTTDPIEETLKAERKFGVYTKKSKKPDNKMKLCINLVSAESMLNICINDSLCKYPEVGKILFETTNGDSTYVLVFVEAFTKLNGRSSCDAGKETKLVFIRWNTATNKATWKQRTVSSCIKTITNMTKEPIAKWDGKSLLEVNYHKGGSNFVSLKFDPDKYLLGFQSTTEN